MRKAVEIFDTTLRDGAQKMGISFSPEEALKIAKMLDDFGVGYIEGGWPGSNPTDIKFFERARKELSLKKARLVAFGATRRKDISVEDDKSVQAIVNSGVSVAAIFGKNSAWQVKHTLRTSLQENLHMIHDTVAYLTSRGIEVIYDAEHFFDGFIHNPKYALEALSVAYKSGASCLVLCDTNGGMIYFQVEEIVKEVVKEFGSKVQIGIHCHNDSDNAVPNTLAAVRSGVTHVQGTFNGFGERCGNADFCSVIPDLMLKMGVDCGVTQENLARLKQLSEYIYEIANQNPDPSQPFVGENAFTHKGGVHASGFKRNRSAYAHIDPAQIGNKQKTAVSRLAGRSTILNKAREMDLSLSDRQIAKILKTVENNEAKGYHYEIAEGSLELLILEIIGKYQSLFRLEEYSTQGKVEGAKRKRELSEDIGSAQAILKIHINGQRIVEDGEGDGHVDALINALKKALIRAYPDLDHFELRDYRVKLVESKEFTGTASVTRVLVEIRDKKKKRSFYTIGVSTDIINASWQAIVDGYTRAMVPYLL